MTYATQITFALCYRVVASVLLLHGSSLHEAVDRE